MGTQIEDRDVKAMARRQQRMADVDAMPPALRACVHDFGLTIVRDFQQCGITDPKTIRHLVWRVLEGSVEMGDRADAPQVTHGGWAMKNIDRVLGFFRLPALGRQIIAYLDYYGMVIVPAKPSDAMIQASIDLLHRPEWANVQVGLWQKHDLRLRAALAAGNLEMEPTRRKDPP